MQRAVLVGLLAVWLATEGDIQLATALRHLGPLEGLSALSVIVRCLSHPALWLAFALLGSHFFLWLYVLARLELSVAVPLTACNYVFNAFLVQVRLGETVSSRRWLGTMIITLGVVLVSRSARSASSASRSETEEPLASS